VTTWRPGAKILKCAPAEKKFLEIVCYHTLSENDSGLTKYFTNVFLHTVFCAADPAGGAYSAPQTP